MADIGRLTPPPASQQQGERDKAAQRTSESKTITETLSGSHCHHIMGYSLIKGIGDGEPIASERFSVGGHEWVSFWTQTHSSLLLEVCLPLS